MMAATDTMDRNDEPYGPDGTPLVIRVTPWGAFATAALVVATAALLFTLGRRFPGEASQVGADAEQESAAWEERVPTVDYEQLDIDPGAHR